jgi:hypothetical protein
MTTGAAAGLVRLELVEARHDAGHERGYHIAIM